MVSFVSKVSKIGLDDIIPILVTFRIGALTTNTVFAQTVGSPDLIRKCFEKMSYEERSFADKLLIGTNMAFSDRYDTQCGGNTLHVKRRDEDINSAAIARHFIEMADEHPYSAIINELADNLSKEEQHTQPFNTRCGIISNTILNIIEKHYDKDTIQQKMRDFITIPYEFPRYYSATVI
jgi:hypothetical protein